MKSNIKTVSALANEKRHPLHPGRRLPRWKLLLFSLSSVLGSLLIIEILLIASGFRYNPHDLRHPLFLTDRSGHVRTAEFFTDNSHFSPATFCHPQSFAARKPRENLRVVLVGGSTVFALGDASRLRQRIAERLGRPVEVINMGILGCGTERGLWSLEEARGFDFDVVVIYEGHNEFTSFSNPMTFHDLPLGLRWITRNWRLFQLFWKLSDTFRQPPALPDPARNTLRGHPYTSAQTQNIYRKFHENLTAMIRSSRACGSKVVIGVVAYNQQRPPSFSRGRLTHQDLSQQSDEQLRQLAAGSLRSSWAAYHLGMRLMAAGRTDEGRRWIEESYVLDPCPLQANRITNAIVRQVAREQSVVLADVESEVNRASPTHLPGADLFLDNCHMNERGNAILLDVVADRIIELAGSTTTKNSQ